MSKFSGIDLHSNNAVVVVSDETDQVVYEKRHERQLYGTSIQDGCLGAAPRARTMCR